MKVCLVANTIGYPEGGGHFWIYLNWAIGLRDAGCEVTWLETVSTRATSPKLASQIQVLQARLNDYGFGSSLVLHRPAGAVAIVPTGIPGLDAAAESELLLNFQYGLSADMVRRFRRSALIDIDPGLLQIWLKRGEIQVTPHDAYFTIGETVGRRGGRIPDVGLRWHYTAPAVSLTAWPQISPAAGDAPFTTVSHWYAEEWVTDNDGSVYRNDKREGFLPFLELPRLTPQAMELALCIEPDPAHLQELTSRGWRVRYSTDVAATPQNYQRYIQNSRGEVSCAKPAYVRLDSAWISDRTICYLASGRPCVVQNTGASRFLPDRCGLLRFKNIDEAAECLAVVDADYERQSRAARALAEEYFDARKVAARVLETAMN
jgi:hypothetical protein